jgi:hypothetical protein
VIWRSGDRNRELAFLPTLPILPVTALDRFNVRLAPDDRYSDNVFGTGVQAPAILRLDAPEEIMSPIAHNPMTLSLLAAV